VVVVGAGLAGLSAARDLAAAGSEVVVLEARERPGGRVEQELLSDGRPVQYGGEVVADWMDAYVGLVAELGLTLEPSYIEIDLAPAWRAVEGVSVGERAPWMDEADRANLVCVEAEFGALSRGVDSDDPWSHPDEQSFWAR
jgi:monoamine oxidase